MGITQLMVHIRVTIGIAIVAIMWLHTSPVWAHAQLIKAEPARRAALDRAPEQIRLWFNEEIEGAYTTLTVFGSNKKLITNAKPRVVKDDPKSIVLPIPETKPGKYTVKFRVLSVDGHVVDSTFNYTVKNKVEEK
ncbi:MAG: copper-binding protein [Nitrosomonadaceae bacterium]|nr:copper-binding protein [Nitrosomonadaceae bacterium]|tara:strand:+ start:1602 stop:2006 length:405 start_codon:yes stop_codon:yes gene_type:complete